MNNNTTSTVNTSASSSSGGAPKNVQKINGTDNSNFNCSRETSGVNSSTLVASAGKINEPPCNTCQRSSPAVDVQSINQSCNANNSRQKLSTAHMSTDDEEEECADSDDQYCVYTYKGDGSSQQPTRLAADLPSSFFKVHPSDSSCAHSSSSSSGIPSLEPSSSSSSHCCHSTSRLHNGTIHNPSAVNINQNNNAMYSPDMDFLEMDFDPGGSGDGCCDGDDEDDDEDVVRDHLFLGGSGGTAVGPSCGPGPGGGGRNPMGVASSANQSGNKNQVLNDDHASAAVVLSKLVVTRSNGSGGCISSESMIRRDRVSEPVAHCSKFPTNNLLVDSSYVAVTGHSSTPSANSLLNSFDRTDEIKLRLVKSVTLPELGTNSCKSSTGGCCSNISCSSSHNCRAMAMSISAPVFQDKLDGPCPTVIPAGKSSEDSMELEVDGVMLWSVQEAKEISISQVGKSACGATACLNVLSALGCIMTTLTPEFVNNCVGTRLRAEEADLPEYLLSRSCAGATEQDLIAGIHRASNGLIYGRFFHVRQETSPSTLNKWLLHWICKGAVPIATLNVQIRRSGEIFEIQDAWHHQMIFGVTRQGIYLTNPLECVPTVELLPQLSSPSILLIRRDDVTKRKGPRTDLRKLARFQDSRWNELNVLGQVSNMLLEEMPVLNGPAGLARRIRTTHISIPAAYKAGITLFIRESNTASCALLKSAPEF